MSSWKSRRIIDTEAFQSLKLFLESKSVRRLYDLKDIQAGKMASALGINYSRYVEKLANPEKFNTFEILRFAYLSDVDPGIIMDIIQNEKGVLELVQTKVKTDLDKLKPGVI